jgi:hypothetical protein
MQTGADCTAGMLDFGLTVMILSRDGVRQYAQYLAISPLIAD